MATRRTFLVFFLLALFFVTCGAKRGFVLSSPKILDAGSKEYFTLALFDVPKSAKVTLKLLKPHNNDVIVETKTTAHNNYNTWIQMDIPHTDFDSAVLAISGRFSGGYRIDDRIPVTLRHTSTVIFIQSDKPIYKPGQTVQFRILPLDSQLVPLTGKTIGQAWIEDSSGIRVAQWKEVDLSEGITQLELPLSTEPVFGTWNILAEVRNVTQSQTFEVQEYVLPKFDVLIEPPLYIMADTEVITAKICAKYTYGKNVEGVVRAKMTYKAEAYDEKPLPYAEYEGEIRGCTDFQVTADELLLHYEEYGFRTIEIFAEVTENETGALQNGSKSLEISHTPLILKFVGPEKNSFYFKHGLPYYGNIQVSKPDGTSASSETIKVCADIITRESVLHKEVLCNAYLSDKDGGVHFVIPPQGKYVKTIELKATANDHLQEDYRARRVKIQTPTARVSMKVWYSPSHSYLQIEPIMKPVQCDKLENVRIRYTTEDGSATKFYHQVISRGRIVQLGSHSRSFYASGSGKEVEEDEESNPYLLKHTTKHDSELFGEETMPQVGEFAFSFDARATLSPKARLLIYYVRKDGEIIADSTSFRITPCLKNQVKLLFRHSQQYPNTEAAMLLSASPTSLCGITFVDKSIHILHPEKKFSKEKVFELMETFDVGKNAPGESYKRHKCKDDSLALRRRRSYIDTQSKRPVDSITAFEEAGTVVLTDLTLETLPCPIEQSKTFDDIKVDGGTYLSRHGLKRTSPEKGVASDIRQPPDEVSDDTMEEVKKPQEDIRSFFPETWLWEVQKIGSSGEIALKRDLPHTITEWVGGAVCIHHKHGLGVSDYAGITAFQPFFASFHLPYSVIRGETATVIVSVFNYLNECLPMRLSLEPSKYFKIKQGTAKQQQFCVCGEKSKSAEFFITPTTLGKVNITVYVYTVKDRAICHSGTISNLGARDAVTGQLLVEAEGFPKEKTITSYFCIQSDEEFSQDVNLTLPNNTVNGSERAHMSITGDLMGPTLGGLDKLVQLPVGCGEQNMLLFTPNIYVLDYLKKSGRLTEEIENKALDYMMKGYQKEIRYRHTDGSYSAFGQSDTHGGSMWLTAFVVKSFAQARRLITVDEKDLAFSTHWIMTRQMENGCFAPTGKVLHQEMLGGLQEENSLAPLTAFVLISMLESGFNYGDMVDNALLCLHTHTNPTTYIMSLFAYATALAKDTETSKRLLEELYDRAIQQDNMMYWDLGKYPDSVAINVETAGYVLLAMLNIERPESVEKGLPIVRWITKQRNVHGGFVSTQDTVVALQALAKYASYTANNKPKMVVAVKDSNSEHRVRIDSRNQLLMQTLNISVIPVDIMLKASGEGCALTQFSLRYNVADPPINNAFDISVTATRQVNKGCRTPTIGICTKYRLSEKSNMAIVEVKMVSGYIPIKKGLQAVLEKKELDMMYYEINGHTINFYFNQITDKGMCFTFIVKSDVDVENAKNATVKVYDYYQPELQGAVSYKIPLQCSLTQLPTMDRFATVWNEESTTLTASESSPTPEDIIDFTTELTNKPESVSEDSFELIDTTNSQTVQQVQTKDFVDIEQDLDFPDGLEANQQVSVLPPEDFEYITRKPNTMCPKCLEDYPENFDAIYCSSAFVLLLEIDTESRKSQVLKDFSIDAKFDDTFLEINYDSSCGCSALDDVGSILLVSKSSDVWSVEDSVNQLNITSSVYIIADTDNFTHLPSQIEHAQNSC